MSRRGREIVAVAVVLACVAAVVVAAISSDGRTSVRAETNDGGAWLVSRADGVVGHLNRTAGEATGLVRISSPGAAFDVEQAEGIVLAHDDELSNVNVVDPRTFQIVNTVSLPIGVETAAIDDGAVFWQPSPLKVWVLDRLALGNVASLDDAEPLVDIDGSGVVTTTTEHELVVIDHEGGSIGRLDINPDDITPDDAPADATDEGRMVDFVEIGDVAAGITDASAIGDDVFGLTDDGIVEIPADAEAPDDVISRSFPTSVNSARNSQPVDEDPDNESDATGSRPRPVLAQPAPAGTEFIVAMPDGSVFSDAAPDSEMSSRS